MAAGALSLLSVSSSTQLLIQKSTNRSSSSLNPDNQVTPFLGQKLSIRCSNSCLPSSRRHSSTVATVSFSLPTSKGKSPTSDGKVPRWSARTIKSFAMGELEARKLKYPTTGTEALLMGILVEGTSLAAKFLRENGVTLFKVRDDIVELLGKADMYFFSPEHPPLTEPAQKALDWAIEEKLKSGESGEVTVAHLLLGIWAQKESAGHRILASHGFNDEKAKELTKNMDKDIIMSFK